MASVEWCAGFFEGEGNFRINPAKRMKDGILHLQIAQVSREPLDAFHKCFGIGKVYGPYGPYQANKQAYYSFMAYGNDALEIAEKLLPHLYTKGEQVRKVLNQYDG